MLPQRVKRYCSTGFAVLSRRIRTEMDKPVAVSFIHGNTSQKGKDHISGVCYA
jgi:hypothetical protein